MEPRKSEPIEINSFTAPMKGFYMFYLTDIDNETIASIAVPMEQDEKVLLNSIKPAFNWSCILVK